MADGEFDFALDDNIGAFYQGADRCDSGAVLVAQWQVVQQVFDAVDAVVGEFAAEAGAHTAQGGNGMVCENAQGR